MMGPSNGFRRDIHRQLSRALFPSLAVGILCSAVPLDAADKAASKKESSKDKPSTENLDKDRLRPLQVITTNTPPASPALFNPDPAVTFPFPPELLYHELDSIPELRVFISLDTPPQSPRSFNPDPKNPALVLPEPQEREQSRVTISPGPVKPPTQFNPDPGQAQKAARREEPFFKYEIVTLPQFGADPVPKELVLPRNNVRLFENVLMLSARSTFGLDPLPAALALPRERVRRIETVQVEQAQKEPYGLEPLPKPLELPRSNTRRNLPAHPHFESDGIPRQKEVELPPNTEAKSDRWRVGFTPWQRYGVGSSRVDLQACKLEYSIVSPK